MYTNIDPIEGTETVSEFIRYFAYDYFPTSVHNVIIELLNLVVHNCIFKLGDNWWLQNIGTAVGTPVACIYTILFFRYYECTKILRKFRKKLLFYK